MTGNEREPFPLGAEFEMPDPSLDETGRKHKPNRLVISGGPMGPQLMMIPTPEVYPEEEDPNP